jgi:hypothetical protein
MNKRKKKKRTKIINNGKNQYSKSDIETKIRSLQNLVLNCLHHEELKERKVL